MGSDRVPPTSEGQTDDFLHIQKVTGANGGVESKTFSVVKFIGGNLTCIVASGSNFRLNDIKQEKKTNIVWEK